MRHWRIEEDQPQAHFFGKFWSKIRVELPPPQRNPGYAPALHDSALILNYCHPRCLHDFSANFILSSMCGIYKLSVVDL